MILDRVCLTIVESGINESRYLKYLSYFLIDTPIKRNPR